MKMVSKGKLHRLLHLIQLTFHSENMYLMICIMEPDCGENDTFANKAQKAKIRIQPNSKLLQPRTKFEPT